MIMIVFILNKNVEHEITLKDLKQPIWIEWPISLVKEARHPVLFSLWVHIVSILLQPF